MANLPLTAGEQSKPRELDIVKIAAGLVTASIVLAGLYFGRQILVPLAIAFLITFMLNPAVTWLVRRGLPKPVATTLVIVSVVTTLAGVGIVLSIQLRSIAEELPRYQSTIMTKLSDLQANLKAPGVLDGVLRTVERVQKQIDKEEQKPAEEEPLQRVQVVPTPPTPFEQAASWLARSAEPLATAGIILIFVFLALLDIGDLRDRLLRLLGGNFNRSTDAMQEAGTRISRYLLMQLIVNVTYGLPLAAGLWMIGVPGALLWGAIGTVMRFVPYIGPLIAAIPPIVLAFAVDGGWSMVFWTIALIVVLELVSNNIVEPLLYGASTGLSAISLITAAIVWTALWGPVGLILSTPLTVCLLVLGRNLPQLNFLEIILGSTPVIDAPTRLYQRLIADDVDEAIELASQEIEKSSVQEFYNLVGLGALRLASNEYLENASAEHRLRLASGMDAVLEDLQDQYPSALKSDSRPAVVCIGGKSEIDTLAGQMLSHALALEGVSASSRPAASVNANYIANLDLGGADVVCLSYFAPAPASSARYACRRLRARFPNLKIVMAFWNASPEVLTDSFLETLKADAVVTSMDEAVRRIHRIVNPDEANAMQGAPLPTDDLNRVKALRATGVQDGAKREELDAIAKRAADVFSTSVAVISAIDEDHEYFLGQSGRLPDAVTDKTGMPLPISREHAICNYVVAHDEALVIPDIDRDPRFADNETIGQWDMRFYAGAPLRLADGSIIGALCILDPNPRKLEEDEVALLTTMAADVVAIITSSEAMPEEHVEQSPVISTATVGQKVPD